MPGMAVQCDCFTAQPADKAERLTRQGSAVSGPQRGKTWERCSVAPLVMMSGFDPAGVVVGPAASGLPVSTDAAENRTAAGRPPLQFSLANARLSYLIGRAYGFKSYEKIEIALYHQLGWLPEPQTTQRFC